MIACGIVSVVFLAAWAYYRRRLAISSHEAWLRHVERAAWSQGIDQSRSTWPWPRQD